MPYRNSEIEFNIPENNFSELLSPNMPKQLAKSNEEEIISSLNHPIGADRLEDIIKPSNRIAILCEDITRYAQTDLIIPILIQRLFNLGVPDENIKIVMVLGSHRTMTEEEMTKKVSKDVFNRFTVDNSENKDKSKLAYAGLTSEDIKVWVYPVVYESDFKIGLGSIEPLTTTGYSGGGKIIYPGVVGLETIANFHIMATSLGNQAGNADNEVRLTMEKMGGQGREFS